jgi:hypothetical protein
MEQPGSRMVAVRLRLTVKEAGLGFERVQIDEPCRSAPIAQDMGRRDIVSDPIYPGSQTAAPVEGGKASPKGDMDLLEQVAPPVGIGFIAPREAAERRAVSSDGFRVAMILFLRRK